MKRFALVVLLAACARHSPPHATAADAERANVELAELEQGRTLLLAKCAGCHKTPLPRDHAPAAWPPYMDEMAPKAKLDAAQRALIERYLMVMATAPERVR